MSKKTNSNPASEEKAQTASAAEQTEETAQQTEAEAAKQSEDKKPEEAKQQEASEFEKAQQALAQEHDSYLRLAAEYDNYRKRTAKEKESNYGDAKADTIKPLLAVYDNLERGIAQYDEADVHRQGLELILRQFTKTLTKLGVTEIEAQGQPFDPEKHNAVMHVEDESAGENTVVEVFQKGFMIGDKVLRFAMVKVAN